MIEPNSKLRLHAYIPLDIEHVNTILFPSVSAQNKYFENAEHTFTNLQYVRQNNNSIKLPISADEAYKYNYMSFQNTSYGSKWFYAFITESQTVTSVSITPSTATLSVGDTIRLYATVEGSNFVNKEVLWSVNSDKATVSNNGEVTILEGASGTIKVTATSKVDSSKSGECTITIS